MSKVIVGGLQKSITFLIVLSFFIQYMIHTDNRFSFFNPQSGATHSSASEGSNEIQEFNEAIPFTLHHEGGLVDDKNDKGGMTKYGISFTYLHSLLAHHPQLLSQFSLKSIFQVTPAVIKKLTKQEAVNIYYNEWWKKYHYGLINKPSIATKAFDYSVNMGATPAIKLLQVACRTENPAPSVNVNGKLDDATLSYINALNTQQTVQLLHDFNAAVAKHYVGIAKKHPSDKKFLPGWLNRVNDNKGLFA